MISKKTAKLVKSLHHKKYRRKNGLFLVEGAKSVQEILQSSFLIETLFVTEDFLNLHNYLVSKKLKENQVEVVSEQTLEEIGTLQTNNAALAVVNSPDNTPLGVENEFVLALDDVRDPGNLGTIIRIADWYGIRKIICSPETAELYNPKVISASMGSFTRVRLYYTDLGYFFQQHSVPVYGAVLEGDNIHSVSFPKEGILLLGNESRGVDKVLMPFLSQKVSIPQYGGAESLNVAIATAVICDNMRRISNSTS